MIILMCRPQIHAILLGATLTCFCVLLLRLQVFSNVFSHRDYKEDLYDDLPTGARTAEGRSISVGRPSGTGALGGGRPMPSKPPDRSSGRAFRYSTRGEPALGASETNYPPGPSSSAPPSLPGLGRESEPGKGSNLESSGDDGDDESSASGRRASFEDEEGDGISHSSNDTGMPYYTESIIPAAHHSGGYGAHRPSIRTARFASRDGEGVSSHGGGVPAVGNEGASGQEHRGHYGGRRPSREGDDSGDGATGPGGISLAASPVLNRNRPRGSTAD